MAVNAEWLHFARVIILSLSVHLSNLVSLYAQVQKRRVTTDFTLTLTLTPSGSFIRGGGYIYVIKTKPAVQELLTSR